MGRGGGKVHCCFWSPEEAQITWGSGEVLSRRARKGFPHRVLSVLSLVLRGGTGWSTEQRAAAAGSCPPAARAASLPSRRAGPHRTS